MRAQQCQRLHQHVLRRACIYVLVSPPQCTRLALHDSSTAKRASYDMVATYAHQSSFSVEFGAILVWFYMCDRTNLFWQSDKVSSCTFAQEWMPHRPLLSVRSPHVLLF